MAYRDKFEELQLKGVTKLNRGELGRGAYGLVYAVKYCQTIYAAKEIHSILVEGAGGAEMQRTIEMFMREWRKCSKLHHPNVIQFIGVYYPTGASSANRMRLPVIVMEMMADSLTSFVHKHKKIPVHIKYSILHDVSLGLCYLHNHDPPIVHRNLSPNNVLLTAHYVAKISNLGIAKVIKADSRKTIIKTPGTVDFMPPEALDDTPEYGPPMDVFSFAGIILHTFNQQWPYPSKQVQFDPKTRKVVALSEVERRQQYLDTMIGEAKVLKSLVEECLDYDPAVRPTIATVCERIQVSKNAYMNSECPQEYITLYQENQQLRVKIAHQKIENRQLRNKNEQKNEIIEQQKVTIDQLLFREIISPTRSMPTQVDSQLNTAILGEEVTLKGSKLRTDAPPLVPTLCSGMYHIKWTRLADLPAPLYGAHVAVQDKKVYIAGGDSPAAEDAEDQVYVYDANTDQWSQLPPSGHYYGIPHIIGGKLAIIGGCLSATKKMTNKVSTFNEDSQAWTSFYPDLLSVRNQPGVFSHLEHVIVAGGVSYTAKDDDTPVVKDDIEILNWIKNLHWMKVSMKLPVPMYGFTPTVSGVHLLIVGYSDANIKRENSAYKIPVTNITASIDIPTKWTKLTAADHWFTALILSSSPPVVVGGQDATGAATEDIKMYDNSDKSWKKIGALSSARSEVAVVAVYDNSIIVIGGCTKGDTTANAGSSTVTVVELGQAELFH